MSTATAINPAQTRGSTHDSGLESETTHNWGDVTISSRIRAKYDQAKLKVAQKRQAFLLATIKESALCVELREVRQQMDAIQQEHDIPDVVRRGVCWTVLADNEGFKQLQPLMEDEQKILDLLQKAGRQALDAMHVWRGSIGRLDWAFTRCQTLAGNIRNQLPPVW